MKESGDKGYKHTISQACGMGKASKGGKTPGSYTSASSKPMSEDKKTAKGMGQFKNLKTPKKG